MNLTISHFNFIFLQSLRIAHSVTLNTIIIILSIVNIFNLINSILTEILNFFVEYHLNV
jgi:hypothetical protein